MKFSMGTASGSMRDEMAKIAAVSAPSIIAPPTPGGDGGSVSSKPAAPVTPKQLVGKVVARTNLTKTNYTKPSTNVVPENTALAAEQKALTPPAVRS